MEVQINEQMDRNGKLNLPERQSCCVGETNTVVVQTKDRPGPKPSSNSAKYIFNNYFDVYKKINKKENKNFCCDENCLSGFITHNVNDVVDYILVHNNAFIKCLKIDFNKDFSYVEFRTLLYNIFDRKRNTTYINENVYDEFNKYLPSEWKQWVYSNRHLFKGLTNKEFKMRYIYFLFDLFDAIDFKSKFYFEQSPLIEQFKTNYFIHKNNVQYSVSKNTFNKTKGKYMSRKVKNKKYGKLNKQYVKCVPQGLLDNVTSVVRGLKIFIKVLQTLSGKENNPNDGTTTRGEIQIDVILPLLIKILLDICVVLETSFQPITIINLLVSFYLVCQPVKRYVTQSIESCVLSAATLLLPKDLYEVIKRMTLFTNSKILDEKSFFSSFFVCVIDFLKLCVGYLPPSVSKHLLDFLNGLPFGEHYIIIEEVKKLVNLWDRNKQTMLHEDFRDKVKVANDNLKKESVVEWSKKSPAVQAIMRDFSRLYRSLRAYEETSRVEPSCFVFEGPPGCMKSVSMNLVIKALNRTTYCHTVKATGDGKDYHDMYAGEEIYFLDDLGQQGVSQFRNLINYVSCVKCPLECAQADLKDTKFFCSPIIMFTTNAFSTLTGCNITKTDCISNIEALHRRGYVFDFSKVINNSGILEGQIIFKHYDVLKNVWLNQFPHNLQLPISPIFKLNGERKHYLKWIHDIIVAIEGQKKEIQKVNVLTQEELDFIRSPIYYDAQSYFKTDWFVEMLEYCSSYFWNALDDLTEIIQTFNWGRLLTVIAGVGIIWAVVSLFKKTYVEVTPQMGFRHKSKNFEQYLITPTSTVVAALQKQIRFIELRTDLGCVYSCALISGHCILMPCHNRMKDKTVITVYKDVEGKQKEWDQMPVDLVYHDVRNDVAIYKIHGNIACPFKNLSHLISSVRKADSLITPFGVYSIHTMVCPNDDVHYKHDDSGARVAYENFIRKDNTKSYKVEFDGLCGSLLADDDKGVIGMHVAAEPGVKGISILWDSKTVTDIISILKEDNRNLINVEVSNKVYDGLSVIRLKSDDKVLTNSKSNIIESPLYGLLPISRFPANLNANGPFTVKDIGKKSMQPVGYVAAPHIQFGKKIIESIIEPFGPLSDKEVILGNESLARMNKKSANGFGCEKLKDIYLNYESGELTPFGKREVDRVWKDIVSGNIDYKDFIWVEMLKDELRSSDKIDIPRSFRCCTIIMQFITKKIFGNMVTQIMKDRQSNGICVGINPLKDWPKLYDRLSKCKHVWGLDFKKWDGGMLPQIQHAIADVIEDKVVGKEETIIASFILRNMPHCLVLMMDDLYQTTHSMPSGSFLTAILNSIVNKFLTACYYYDRCLQIEREPSIKNFNDIIVDFLYGDDRTNGSMDGSFGAISMARYFESLGLQVTDDKKNPVINDTVNIQDISFLKRQFAYSPRFKKIVCPLDRKTIFSSISWYDSTKDVDVVMHGKLDAFQREAFLHEDYKHLIDHVIYELKNRGYEYNFRPDGELYAMVRDNDIDYIDFYSANAKYN